MHSSVSAIAVAVLVFGPFSADAQGGSTRLTPYVGFLSAGSIAEGPFGVVLGNAGAPVYGVQLSLGLTPNLAVVGNLGFSDSDLQVGLPFVGGIGLADSRMLLYDAGVQLRFPATTGGGTGMVPFVEGGVGGIRHEITVGPVRTTSTNVAVIAGGGVDLQLTAALGLRVMAKDHMSRFDYGEAIGVASEGRRAHNWVLGVGLNIGR